MPDASQTPAAGAGLHSISAPDGTLAIVAMDQRNTLRRMLTEQGRPTDGATIEAFKVDVVEALSPVASAVLLDPQYGVPAVQRAGAMAAGCATLVAVEPAERASWQGEPRAGRDPELTARRVSEMGGDAVKLLVQLRPDRPHSAGQPDLVAEVVEVVREVVADCAEAGVPSVIETLLYKLPGEHTIPHSRRAQLIAESARILSETHPDLLKLEYPGDASGCRAVANAVTVPWAMLSAGMPFDDFLQAVVLACEEGGACGFIAGRVYWKEAVALDGADRKQFLASTGRARLERSIATMSGRARPWHEGLGSA
jgi:tagatose 1,6-diphosphate aldolase/sulfofructosephosphate aldolase